MASVDLYGNDAGTIRNAYKTKLRRDASDQEVSGWLSGSYGGGGVNDWVNQIGASGEAQQYNPQPALPQVDPTQPSQPAPWRQTPQAPPVIGQNPNVSRPQETPADPWATARSGITSLYQQHLGRDPGAGDVDKWLSGGYGYGSGLQDYDKIVTAIMGSEEARKYRPPGGGSATDGGYQNTEWWQQRGVPTIDIFDPMTGQLRQGWKRTGKGYERTSGTNTTSNVPGPQGGNFQQWFQQLTNGKRVSPKTLKEMEPILNQYGIKLGPLNARGFTDGIILPDGTFVDVILSAVEDGGTGWGWITGGGGGGGGNVRGVGGGQLPGDQYNDPYSQLFEQLIKARIGMLQQGVNDPYRQQYMSGLQGRADALGNAAEPAYQALLKRLEERFTDLQGPGYTGAENEVIRTGALDPIESDRAAAKKRMIERMAAAGHTMESGVMQMALNEVDKAFDGMRAKTQTTLTTNDLERREDRATRADSIKGTLYDIPQARSREQLDVFGAMQLLEGAMRGEEEARSREAIGYGGALNDLSTNRLQLAMQAAGMGGNPSSMFQNLLGLSQLNQNSSMLNQQNSSQLWSGLGSIAAILAGAGR